MIVLYKWKSLTMGSSDWGFFLVSGEILLYVHPGRDRDRLVWMKHACVGVLGLPLSVPSFSRPCSGSLWEKFLSWLSWSHWDLQSPSSIENTPSSHCKREGGQLRPNTYHGTASISDVKFTHGVPSQRQRDRTILHFKWVSVVIFLQECTIKSYKVASNKDSRKRYASGYSHGEYY